MAIRHIVVHLDCSREGSARLVYAVGLAARQGAAVTGCCWDDSRDRRMELQEELRQKAEAAGVVTQWFEIDADSEAATLDEVCRLASCSDLVVVGQPSPGKGGRMRRLPEKLVGASGRPVLILPYAGIFSPEHERVMIAWSGGRESVRSLHDALPLLRQAEKVHLLSMQAGGSQPETLRASLDQLGRHLLYHNVQSLAEVQVCVGVEMGDMLLNRSAEKKADLLVAGGYHEGQMGKIAAHLIRHMTVPVLMSH